MELDDIHIPILRGHALDTSANTNIDHTGLDSVGDVHDGLQTTGALSVQGLDSGGLGEACNEGSSTELSGTTSRRQNGANRDILDGGGVDATALNDGLECTGQQVGGGGILKTTLSSLGDSSSKSTSDDDIVGVLLRQPRGALVSSSTEVRGDLAKTLLCCKTVHMLVSA